MPTRAVTLSAMVAVTVLDAPALRRWTELSAKALGDARTAIDAINVFPVPDGDTGTNLYLTVVACAEAVAGLPEDADHARVWATLTETAMRNARGNSGVLWSQALRGLAEVLRSERTDASALRDALRHAAALARAAVQRPVEGTLLTVLDAAAAAAVGESPTELAHAAADAAWAALAATPGQLRELAEGGVVDAGAAGLCLLLDALAAVTSGRAVRPLELPDRPYDAPGPAAAAPVTQEFEVMYLLDSDPGRVADLRAALDTIGDSLMITGGDGTWQVHVHTGDAGGAVELGTRAGHAYRFRVSCLRDHAATGRVVLALPPGPALAGLFAYPDVAVPSGPLDTALRAYPGARVAVVPGSPESCARARTVLATTTAELIPADTAVRQLAALAVHDPDRPFPADVAAMTEAARAVRAGRVTAADGIFQASGDGVPAFTGSDMAVLGTALADRLVAYGGELVTIVAREATAGERVRDAVRTGHPATEVVVYIEPALAPALEIGVE